MPKKSLIIPFIVLLTAGCSTVTMQPERTVRPTGAPSYEERKDFYFFGLSGEHRVNVKAICGEKKVKQMQTQATFEDGVATLFTLGIYAPHTVRVWCE